MTMPNREEQLEKLRRAFENGIIDQATYDMAKKGFAGEIRDSQVGVLGDDATIGVINFYGGREDPKGLLRRYLNDLAAETNRLPWGRLQPEQAGLEQKESLRLTDVFTALDTTEPDRLNCEEDVRRCLAQQEAMKRISAQQMINDHQRLILLGDPGCGKTTIVKFISHVMACSGVSKDVQHDLARLQGTGPWDHGPLLPIRIVLREFAAWLESSEKQNRPVIAWMRKTLNDVGLEDLWPIIHDDLQDPNKQVLILLDGLDEVPGAQRESVVNMINEFNQEYVQNRYLVTCRVYAYLDKDYRLHHFRQAILAPFNDEQIESFIEAWYRELVFQKRVSKNEAETLEQRLKAAVQRPDLRGMAERPLLMTIMAQLQTSFGQLPQDRVELYQWAVDLLFRRWKGDIGQGEKDLMAALEMPQLKVSDLLAGLNHVAYQAHAGQQLTEETAEIAEEILLKHVKPYLGDDWNRAETFVRYVRERSGLLIRHKPDAYTFLHRTFQEFMAACHLTSLKDYPREAARLVKEDPDLWRVVYVLAAGHASKTQLGNAISSVGKLCVQGVTEAETNDGVDFLNALISGEALLEIGLAGVEREEDGKAILNRTRHWLVAALNADEVLIAQERAEASTVLGKVGDPRPEVTNVDDMQFCLVPKGPFLYEEEGTQAELDHDYWIGLYPVTQGQFDAFVRDGGYSVGQYWIEAEEEGFWKDGRYKDTYDDAFRSKPVDYGTQFHLDNHPVVGVSWHEAVAFTRWLTERWQRMFNNEGLVRLASEREWEKAARGGLEVPVSQVIGPVKEMMNEQDTGVGDVRHNPRPSRGYPWGEGSIMDRADPERFNCDETGLGSTTAVGCFSRGSSPYGLQDMSGTVWEWCLDVDGRDRVLRGGAWYVPAKYCRVASRLWSEPAYRSRDLGFRLVYLQGLPSESSSEAE